MSCCYSLVAIVKIKAQTRTAYSSIHELNPFNFFLNFITNFRSHYSIRWCKILPRSSTLWIQKTDEWIDDRQTDLRWRTSPKKQGRESLLTQTATCTIYCRQNQWQIGSLLTLYTERCNFIIIIIIIIIIISLLFKIKSSQVNKCLPSEWNYANITPLYKKGSRSHPGNYRPVSLTSIVCKLMESIIRDSVTTRFKLNHLLCPRP